MTLFRFMAFLALATFSTYVSIPTALIIMSLKKFTAEELEV